MKVLFIEAKKNFETDINKIDFTLLPNKISLVYSIQYKKLAEKIREKLSKRVRGFKQVLGCSKFKSKYPILLISSGRFHALNLALQGNIVYVLEGNKINKLNREEVNEIKNKRKTAFLKFLAAEKVGILVSIKPGQENLREALKLEKKLEKKGKDVRIFLADNISLDEIENYNMESWINTACQALTFDSRILNMHELKNKN